MDKLMMAFRLKY